MKKRMAEKRTVKENAAKWSMRKRFAAAGLAFVLALSGLTGCGKGVDGSSLGEESGLGGENGLEKENGGLPEAISGEQIYASEGTYSEGIYSEGDLFENEGTGIGNGDPQESGTSGTGAKGTGTSGTGAPGGVYFDSGKFSGNLRGIYYAGEGKLLVQGDVLSLYDISSGEILGEYEETEGKVSMASFHSFSQGYALVGLLSEKEEGGEGTGEVGFTVSTEPRREMTCWIFDKNLNLTEKLDLDGMAQEQGGEIAFSGAVSEDGGQVAVASLRGVTLYDRSKKTMKTILEDGPDAEGFQGILANEVHFTETGGLLFTGIAIPAGRDSSVPVYGTCDLDGGNLQCTSPRPDFAMSGEMLVYPEEIWLTEAFDQAKGEMLMLDASGRVLRKVELEGEDTGADGIFGSDQGHYIATGAMILSGETGWRFRIYDASDGKMVWERTIALDLEEYPPSCSVAVLEETGECIMICGRGKKTVSFVGQFS